MSIEEQQPPATEAATTETLSAAPRRGWPSPEVWLLGAMGIFGLIGFVVAFGLVMARTTADPQAATQRVQAPGQAQSFVSPQQQAAGQQGVGQGMGQSGPPGPRARPVHRDREAQLATPASASSGSPATPATAPCNASLTRCC